MRLAISKERTIHDVQQDFSNQYPFLKLDFYRLQTADPHLKIKKHLPGSTPLKAAGLKLESGTIDLQREMTVGELESLFLKKFGLDVQVSRKSGLLWLETTMTDNWTLQKQNEHGREISVTARVLPKAEEEDDYR